MGIEFFLVNHQDKTIFELGKHFYNGFHEPDWVKDIPKTVQDSVPPYREGDWVDYTQDLTKRITKFCNDTHQDQLALTNDCDDSFWEYFTEPNWYTPTGSRYEPEETYVKHLLELQKEERASYEDKARRKAKASADAYHRDQELYESRVPRPNIPTQLKNLI